MTGSMNNAALSPQDLFTMVNTLETNAAGAAWKSIENMTHYVFVPYVLYKVNNKIFGKSPTVANVSPGVVTLSSPNQSMWQKFIKIAIAEGISDLLHTYWAQASFWEMYKGTATSFLSPIMGEWFLGRKATDENIYKIFPDAGSQLSLIYDFDHQDMAYKFGKKVVDGVQNPEKIPLHLIELIKSGGYALAKLGFNTVVNVTSYLANGGLNLMRSLLTSGVNATFVPLMQSADKNLWDASRYAEQKTGMISAENVHYALCAASMATVTLCAFGVAKIGMRYAFPPKPPMVFQAAEQFKRLIANKERNDFGSAKKSMSNAVATVSSKQKGLLERLGWKQ